MNLHEDILNMVIDLGSQSIKGIHLLNFTSLPSLAGFAGDDAPRACVPNCLGTPNHINILSQSPRNGFVGEEVQKRRGILSLSYPIQHGIITNWDDFQTILTHTFKNELRVNEMEHPVLFSRPLFNPRSEREKLVEIMFERFYLPATYLVPSPLLAGYASGKTRFFMLDIGDMTTEIFPSWWGGEFAVNTARRFDFGGRDITRYLVRWEFGFVTLFLNYFRVGC